MNDWLNGRHLLLTYLLIHLSLFVLELLFIDCIDCLYLLSYCCIIDVLFICLCIYMLRFCLVFFSFFVNLLYFIILNLFQKGDTEHLPPLKSLE